MTTLNKRDGYIGILNELLDLDYIFISDIRRVKGFKVDLYLHNVKRAIKGYNQVFYKPKVI